MSGGGTCPPATAPFVALTVLSRPRRATSKGSGCAQGRHAGAQCPATSGDAVGSLRRRAPLRLLAGDAVTVAVELAGVPGLAGIDGISAGRPHGGAVGVVDG